MRGVWEVNQVVAVDDDRLRQIIITLWGFFSFYKGKNDTIERALISMEHFGRWMTGERWGRRENPG